LARGAFVEFRRELLIVHLVADRLKAVVIGHFRRASRHSNNEIHLRLHNDVVPGFAFWWQNGKRARLTIHGNVHKNIEADWYLIGCNTVITQRLREIAETTAVRILMAVDYPEGITAAWCEQKIMLSYGILKYSQHDVAAIRVQGMSFGEEDRLCIV
jgi:hypothetical protein